MPFSIVGCTVVQEDLKSGGYFDDAFILTKN